jgi:hypothetical protein
LDGAVPILPGKAPQGKRILRGEVIIFAPMRRAVPSGFGFLEEVLERKKLLAIAIILSREILAGLRPSPRRKIVG